jgi:RNA polymerase-binding transcription factor DksA
VAEQLTQSTAERRQELQKEHQRILKEMDRIRAYLGELRVAEGGVDPDASERMMNLSIMENLERKRQSVEHALSALDRGKYGLCERCGQPIEAERLKVLPDTTLCIKCKVELERER